MGTDVPRNRNNRSGKTFPPVPGNKRRKSVNRHEGMEPVELQMWPG